MSDPISISEHITGTADFAGLTSIGPGRFIVRISVVIDAVERIVEWRLDMATASVVTQGGEPVGTIPIALLATLESAKAQFNAFAAAAQAASQAEDPPRSVLR